MYLITFHHRGRWYFRNLRYDGGDDIEVGNNINIMCAFGCVICVCRVASCATLLLIMSLLTLAFEGSCVNPHLCICLYHEYVREQVCMHAHASSQSKPPLGSRSHQLLIKLTAAPVCRLMWWMQELQCVSVYIWAAALDFYTISAEYRVVVYKSRESVGIWKVCVFVSSVALIADAVSLITHTRQLKLRPPQLTASTLLSVFTYFLSLALSIHFPHVPCFSLPAVLSSLLTMLHGCLALLSFFFLFLHVLHSMPGCPHTHILAYPRHLNVCVCYPVLSTIIDVLFRKENKTSCSNTQKWTCFNCSVLQEFFLPDP